MKSSLRIFLLSVLILGTNVLVGQDFPDQPVPPRIVNDFAGVFSSAERASLERKLVAFNDSTTTQIAVVSVKSLHGYDPNDYAVRLLELWGIGQKGKDNGILILIKPKTNDERGQVAISVGYGLEGVVPDATAKMIIVKEMIPSFQENDYYGGTVKAAHVLFQLTRNEFTAQDYNERKDQPEGGFSFLAIIIILIILFILFSGRKGRKRGIRSSFPWWMIGGMGGHSGGGWSGGSSGGGFGGFGGGRGGGGGASGSW